jgi:hypothetical protein
MEPPLPEVDLQPRSVKKFFFSNKFTWSCQGKFAQLANSLNSHGRGVFTADR